MGEIAMRLMHVIVLAAVFGSVWTISSANPLQAEKNEPSTSIDLKTIRGEILKIEGEIVIVKDRTGKELVEVIREYFILKDLTGKEIRLQVEGGTLLDSAVAPGDEVEVEVWNENRLTQGIDGYAWAIREVTQ